MPKKNTWTIAQSEALYGINNWGTNNFLINDDGNLCVKTQVADKHVSVAVKDIIDGLKQRGMDMPCVLRIENILDERIQILNESFAKAMDSAEYKGHYRAVFPIKVNQQSQVIEEIADFGQRYNHGLEAGSKAELMIALSQLKNTDSLIICNGYKDAEFIELGLYAIAMGIKCFFVIESNDELNIIMEQSLKLGIDPLIGIRIRLATTVDGHWSGDSGDGSIFGLSTAGLVRAVETLKQLNKLHCLQLLHSHLGSQIPNIRNVRIGVQETCQFYAGLIAEGAPMGYLDLGGGLAVDYDGTQSNSTHSMNYHIDEYCTNIVESIREALDPLNIPHPNVVTESGRATVAYSSILLFNILNVRSQKPQKLPEQVNADWPEELTLLFKTYDDLNVDNIQTSLNNALFYRDEIRQKFQRGDATLRDRANAEELTLAIIFKIKQWIPSLTKVPQELEDSPEYLADIYYGNFSLFQSLPDMWAIDQIFPIMPIHRLDQQPENEAVIADMTCDCDGKIDRFAINGEIKKTIPLHTVQEAEEYYLGVFLVGAYQETLGDLHNLFGDTNVVSVAIKADASFEIVRELQGDSIADVLSYVEYSPAAMLEQLRKKAEKAVQQGLISTTTRKQILDSFRQSFQGYTYFER